MKGKKEGKAALPFRKTAYEQYARSPGFFTKSILEGLKPVSEEPPCAKRLHCHALSERMRKRRTFADKELEGIMLQRELRQRELEELYGLRFLHPAFPAAPAAGARCWLLTDPPSTACLPTCETSPLVLRYHFLQFQEELAKPRTTRSGYGAGGDQKGWPCSPPLRPQRQGFPGGPGGPPADVPLLKWTDGPAAAEQIPRISERAFGKHPQSQGPSSVQASPRANKAKDGGEHALSFSVESLLKS